MVNNNDIFPISIESELKKSYLDYAMSVIVGRALPDVRDGLKPVHRRILFAMKNLSNDYNKSYKKSARVVGDVIGKYHPHGDSAVYSSIVRMAQYFSLRYPLIDGQGNFGSVDGDSPAAMRYTEIRMKKISHYLLEDLDKETVDFSPNYDDSEYIPDVLPTRVPNLLINGSSGIAVGVATNIPPHNLNEVINACISLIKNKDLTISDLMEYIKGPDFPTSAIINGNLGVIEAYKTGKGKVIIRSKATIEISNDDKEKIIITELPYQVNKAKLIEKIVDLVKHKKIEGISEIRDESDKDGLRVVIDVRTSFQANIILNNLFKQTQMQLSFGINMVALSNGQPKLLNLKQILEEFIKHRTEVVIKRTIFDLRKAKERAHILEGLLVALENIDKKIDIIKASKNSSEAKNILLNKLWKVKFLPNFLKEVDINLYRKDGLSNSYGLRENLEYKLSMDQVNSILDLKLNRLTGLEKDKITLEFNNILLKIKEYIYIIKDSNKLNSVIIDELKEIKRDFGDERKTKILDSHIDLENEDLIKREQIVITLSEEGYVKRQSLSDYQLQHRGGKGKRGASIKDTDNVYDLIVSSTHDILLCFSNKGKVYSLRGFEIPLLSRISKGRPINNILPIEDKEKITSILSLSKESLLNSKNQFIFMVTKLARAKRVNLSNFAKVRVSGIIAINLDENDELISTVLTDGNRDIMIFSSSGKALRANENDFRDMGRIARGVLAMKIESDDFIISSFIVNRYDDNDKKHKGDSNEYLIIRSDGKGKKTLISEFKSQSRNGKGIIAIRVNKTKKIKAIKAIKIIDENQNIILMTNKGSILRTSVNEISNFSRNSKGVIIKNLTANEEIISLRAIKEDI